MGEPAGIPESLEPIPFDQAAIAKADNEKVDKLFNELDQSREALRGQMKTIDDLTHQVTKIFPDGTAGADFRSSRQLDDKLKVFASFFATSLSLRKEFNKLVSDEIGMRLKRGGGGSGSSGGADFNVHDAMGG